MSMSFTKMLQIAHHSDINIQSQWGQGCVFFLKEVKPGRRGGEGGVEGGGGRR